MVVCECAALSGDVSVSVALSGSLCVLLLSGSFCMCCFKWQSVFALF